MRRVILESPYRGKDAFESERNIQYARAALHDCLMRNEAPLASHLLYTQEGVLDDSVATERELGIEAGLAWLPLVEATVVYTDLGISEGMWKGINRALERGITVEIRRLPGWSGWKTTTENEPWKPQWEQPNLEPIEPLFSVDPSPKPVEIDFKIGDKVIYRDHYGKFACVTGTIVKASAVKGEWLVKWENGIKSFYYSENLMHAPTEKPVEVPTPLKVLQAGDRVVHRLLSNGIGTIHQVRDTGEIYVKWDNGRHDGLYQPNDLDLESNRPKIPKAEWK